MGCTRTIAIWIALGMVGVSTSANATTIFYEVTPLSGDTWRYDYTLVNDSLAVDIEEFTVFFDLATSASLVSPLAPVDWDPIAIQPDAGLLADGFYDALALGPGVAPGDSLSGFSVELEFTGAGAPGPQAFDVVDALDPSIVLDSGTTLPLPEPGVALLVGLGLVGLALVGRRSAPAGRVAALAVVGLAASGEPAEALFTIPADRIDVVGVEVTSARRVGRTRFQYDLRVTFRSDFEISQLEGIPNSRSSAMQIVGSGWRNLGTLPAGAEVPVDGALTVIVDRRSAFDPGWLRWVFRGDGPPQIEVERSFVDFGDPSLGCDQLERVDVRNVGVGTALIELAGSVPDPAESIDYDGNPSVVVGSFQTRGLFFRFVPLDTAAKSTSYTFTTNDPSLSEFTISLSGGGTESPSQQDLFTQGQAAEGPIDVLFTLDRSGSMGDNLAAVIQNIDAFVSGLVASGDDFHLAAVVGDDGCVVGPDAFIDDGFSTSDAQMAFETMVDLDFAAAPYGSNTERGFTLAEAALQPAKTGVGGCNEGFLRDLARLATVHVSDEPEQSVFAWNTYVSLFQALKADPADVSLNAVAGDYPSGCGTASAGSGYFEAARATGGLFLSICTDDWGADLADLAGALGSGVQNTFTLSERPVPELVRVTVDGVEQSGGFSTSSSWLTFEAGSIPPPGASLQVDYPILSCN